MLKQMKVNEDVSIIETTQVNTQSLEEYLKEIARRMELVDTDIHIIQKKIDKQNSLIDRLKFRKSEIKNEFDELLQNRKTTIKKKVGKNRELNNLLSMVFPKDFKFKELPLQKTETSKKLICDRMIAQINPKTNQKERVRCEETFDSKKAMNLHLAKHKKNKELI